MKLLKWISVVSAACALSVSSVTVAQTDIDWQTPQQLSCPDAKIFGARLITDICWESFFPLMIAGRKAINSRDGSFPYHGRFASGAALAGCRCQTSGSLIGTVGVPLGFYMPAKLIEVTKRPACSPTLGGAKLDGLQSIFGKRAIMGGMSGSNADRLGKTGGFYHWNYFSFPILQMLQILDLPTCLPDSRVDLDLIQSSIVYPNWGNGELAAFLNPEMSLLTSTAGLAAMPISAGLANTLTETTAKIDDNLFWVAGSWGMIPPFTGAINRVGPVTGHSLTNVRAMAMLSRIGLLRSMAGKHASGKCEKQLMPIFQKSQFKYSMLFPVPEAKGAVSSNQPFASNASNGREVDFVALDGTRCAHNIGKSEMLWGSWRQRPATGEDYVTLVWQWVDCCLGMFKL